MNHTSSKKSNKIKLTERTKKKVLKIKKKIRTYRKFNQNTNLKKITQIT